MNLDTLLCPVYAKNGDLMHSVDCKMSFGRKDLRCPRCVELAHGSTPRARFNGRLTRADQDALRVRANRMHDCTKSRCGVVCTFGDW